MEGKHRQVEDPTSKRKTYLIIIIILLVGLAVGLKSWSSNSDNWESSDDSPTETTVTKRKATPQKSKPKAATNSRSYQPTATIGRYSVSTEALNTGKFYYDRDNLSTSLKLQLDNQTGKGHITFFNSDTGEANSYHLHYQEIKTKILSIKNTAGIRTVKVNTALVFDSNQQKVYYAFKNSSGTLSLAIPHDKDNLYREALQSVKTN